MILLVDNYDSFVHTLAGYVRELGHEALVIRNDAVTLDEVQRVGPSHIIISPGPGTPSAAGISTAVVRRFGATTPILGVCLGHQCIGEAYGGRVVRARPRHGQASAIRHDGTGLFAGLPSPFRAARYHSLMVDRSSLPADLRVTAESDDDIIMALAHRTHPVVGLQFHPESVLSDHGHLLIDRFLHL
jgi:anthranilate synthase/aminodeoxychorismate synthase-like glutamine amidotransferase